MSAEAYVKNWGELTSNDHESFLKADVIMKNPAPANVTAPNVLKQVAQFTKSCLNMHVLPPVANGYKMLAIG